MASLVLLGMEVRAIGMQISAGMIEEHLSSLTVRKLLSEVSPLPRSKPKHILIEHARTAALANFKQHERAPANHVHRGTLAIKQHHLEELTAILYDVSNPFSKNYGKHWTREEIDEFTIDPRSVRHVLSYLQQYPGVTVVDQSLAGEFIEIEAPIEIWETILDTQFYEFSTLIDNEVESGKDKTNHVRLVRAHKYSLPQELSEHVSYVFNVVSFPTPKELSTKRKVISDTRLKAASKGVTPLANSIIQGYVTPALINKVYSIGSNTGSNLASHAVYETIGQSFSPSDLLLFQKTFGLSQQAVTTVIGGNSSNLACTKDHGNNCIEANLDVQYLMAIAQNVPTTYYYWGGSDFMNDWLTAVSKMKSPPKVFSISYGADEDQITASYGATFNTLAIKLGVQGVSITVASGDDGAISASARKNPLRCGFSPSFPASSPYVTSVGGTMGPENGLAEMACQSDKGGIITSGGGFSSIYDLPDWQKSYVSSYFNAVDGTSSNPVAGYAIGGRGYPDISVLAYNYIIAVGGNFTAVSGTSAASPVFAGMLSLINSARLAAGQSTVGWVNPALYAFSSQFVSDIVDGNNNCVASATVCCSQGYYATTGWDPVTGLGSLNFAQFKSVMMNGQLQNFNYPSQAPTPVPGSPTITPTAPTTKKPSAKPTARPTSSAGWLRMTQYSEENCQGEITVVSGVNTDRCLQEYDQNLKVSGSLKYSCSNGKSGFVNDFNHLNISEMFSHLPYFVGMATLSLYSDASCTDKYKLEDQTFAFGCAYKVEDYYYSPTYYSVNVDCVEGAHEDALVSNLVGKYALQRYRSLL